MYLAKFNRDGEDEAQIIPDALGKCVHVVKMSSAR